MVEHLLLVRGEQVVERAVAVDEHDDLVVDLFDAQPAARDEVEQRRDRGVRGDHEPVGQQARDGRRLVADLGRLAARDDSRRREHPRPDDQHEDRHRHEHGGRDERTRRRFVQERERAGERHDVILARPTGALPAVAFPGRHGARA